MNGSLLPFVMAHRIFDDQLKLPPTDFSGQMRLKVDSLDALLDPARTTPGHPFGTLLSNDDRAAIVAYVKTL